MEATGGAGSYGSVTRVTGLSSRDSLEAVGMGLRAGALGGVATVAVYAGLAHVNAVRRVHSRILLNRTVEDPGFL
jgi:hypothetical protein